MKLGADRKRLAVLAILGAIYAWLLFRDPSPPPAPPAAPVRPAVAAAPRPLALSLLTRLLRVSPAGDRNLFQYAEAPIAEAPIQGTNANAAPVSPAADSPVTRNVEPLTFYGYVTRRARPLRGFFSDGSEIYICAEGEVIAGRYKVIRIGAAMAVLEDTVGRGRHTLTMDQS